MNDDKRPRILVVDDQPFNLKLIKVALRDEWRLLTACGGEEALRLIRKGPRPDLILLDVIMPEMDGHEVCRRLKADPATADLPVVFVTASDDVENEAFGLGLGAIDYVTKPINPTILRARVRNHLRLKLYQDALQLAQDQLRADLAAAALVQRTLLPKNEVIRPAGSNAVFHWHFSPCEEMGGDLVAITPWDEDHTLVYLLDVAGHGFRAAMVTVSIAQFLQPSTYNREVLPFLEPASMIGQLEIEFPFDRFESYFTIIYGVFHHPSRTIRFCNAGQPPPVAFRPGAEPDFLLKTDGSLVGMGLNQGIAEQSLTMGDGDSLLFYTDGLLDCRNSSGACFGKKAWPFLLPRLAGDGGEGLMDRLSGVAGEFRAGTPLFDDLTMLFIRCLPLSFAC